MRSRIWYLSSILVQTLFVVLFSATLIGQQPTAGGAPVFSTVSIRPSASSHHHHMEADDRHFMVANWPLRQIIQVAYGMPYYFQVAGPEWIDSANYDINARVGQASLRGVNSTLQARAGRLSEYPAIQALLRDRFGLVMHTERRPVTAFALVVAKGGPKLKAAPPNRHTQAGISDGPSTGILEGKSATLQMLANSLGGFVSTPLVYDRTGLPGVYDFTLHWNPNSESGLKIGPAPYQEPNANLGSNFEEQCVRGQVPTGCVPDSAVPALSTALREELGLELQLLPAAGVDTVVIDAIDRPVAN